MPDWLVFSRVSVLVQGQLMWAATVLVLPILTWVRETELASPLHRPPLFTVPCTDVGGPPSRERQTTFPPQTQVTSGREELQPLGFLALYHPQILFFNTHV